LQIMPELEPVDLVLTDPPYGTTACKWDSVLPSKLLWEQLKGITKKDSTVVLFGSQPYTSILVMSNLKMFKYELIWDKVSGKDFYQAGKRPLKQHENILVFSKGNTVFNPQTHRAEKKNMRYRIIRKATKGTIYGDLKKYIIQKDESKRYPGSIFIHSYQANEMHYSKRLHPTQKPVALIEYLIRTYTNEGYIVADNCIGSGTTAIACERLKRKWIGIEIEEKYCEIAAKRIEAERKQLKLF